MKEIRVTVGSDEYKYKCPERWGEVSGMQFEVLVSQLMTYGRLTLVGVRKILGMGSESYQLMPIDWMILGEQLEWMKDMDGVEGWMIEEIDLGDGRKVYPCAANFDDMTWEEFMFVDVSAGRKAWDVVAACLYRPLKEGAGEEEDDRIGFTRYGVSARLGLFKELGPSVLSAVEVNFVLLRKRMTDKYKNVFRTARRKVKAAGSEKEEDAGTDWVGVYRRLLGEHVWEEERLLKLPVNTVLYRLDNLVKEGREREREMRRSRRRR